MPKSLIEAVRYFSDLSICDAYMTKIKWPSGKITCPNCANNKQARIGEIPARRRLYCKDCRKQFSYKTGTIFEDSPLGLDKWFVAVWCIANAKNGISSHELSRAIGVTQKTAWFMLHRIRLAMETGTFKKFDGTVESDETYVGGKAKNMHKHKREKAITGRGAVNKTIVHGILQRRTGDMPSQVVANVIPNDDARTVTTQIARAVTRGGRVFTDKAKSYERLALSYLHSAVDHSCEYVRGQVHTNGIENFWMLLKRGLFGTYVSVAPFHLHRYVAEQVFRFNHRTMSDQGRFTVAMSRVVGRRITYRVLCGIDDAGFMGLT